MQKTIPPAFLLIPALVMALLSGACNRSPVAPETEPAESIIVAANEVAANLTSESQVEGEQEDVPAGDSAVAFSVPPLTWQQLKNGAFSVPAEEGGPADGLVPLEDGAFSYLPAPDSTGTNEYSLYPDVAYGDLNSDGVEDALVILRNESAGTGSVYHLVPVLNVDGDLQPLSPTNLGERVFVDTIQIVDGEGQLHLRSYRPDEALGSTPTLLISRRYVLRGNGLELLSEEVLDANETAREMLPRPVTTLELPEAGGTITRTDNTAPLHLDRFALSLSAGQELTITLTTRHQDAFLSLYGAETANRVINARDELARWQGVVPQTELFNLNVFAVGAETSYELILQAGPPPEPSDTDAPPPVATEVPEQDRDIIYLTFDDGPTPPYSEQILDLLAQYNARATFFVVGLNAERFPELLEQARQAGHTLANHTWDHPSLAGMGQAAFNETVLRTAQAIGAGAAPCLRPPYGATDAFTRAYAAELGYEVVMWHVDPVDWRRPGVQAISTNVLANAFPGAIVLMHDGGGERTQTVAALEVVLRELSGRGYVFEPLCR